MNNFSYNNVQRWHNDIFEYEKVFIPINLTNGHYALVVVYNYTKVIQYYDSLHWDGELYVNGILKFMILKSKQLSMHFDENEWTLVPSTLDVPRQNDGSMNCGVYVCLMANRISSNLDYTSMNGDLVDRRGRLYIESCLLENSVE